jgi:hypothetical protein
MTRGIPLITMREALRRSEYFGDVLAGESWANWRILLIAIAGEALDEAEAVTFKALSGRAGAPTEAAREFWAIIGRRGGKSRAAAVLAAWLAACKDYRHVLAPGERGQLQVLSATRDQAGNLFNFVSGIFEASRALCGLVESKTADTLCLKCHIDIVVRPASFRSTRGSTCVGVLCDEISFWHSDDSSNPDTEILRALRPSLMTTGGPLVAISSPYARRGELWKAYRKHYLKDDSRVLVVQAASAVMNPGLDRSFIDAQYEDDPIAAAAEYGANFRSDIAEFVSMDVLEACTADGVFEIPPISGATYLAFVDPSGGSSDSMTLGIAHREDDGVAVLDCVREAMAPFSPELVVEDFCRTLAAYGVAKVCGDRYAGEWPREQFAKRNVTYEPSEKVKSDIYRDMLPLLNSRKCELLDNRRLISQLHGLERRTARGGKDSIDHSPGAHDDIANAVAGALVLAAGELDYAALWRKFGEVFDAPREAGTDRFDPQTRAALIWHSHRDRWRDYATSLDVEVIETLEAIERDQESEMKCG